MGGAFAGCSNVRVNSSDIPDLSHVTDMHYMFYQASNFNQNIEDWNVSNVKNMRGLLYEASSFNQSLASWNVSEVTNMSNMLTETSISINNYDDILDGWSNQTLQENVDFSIGNIHYSNNASEVRENIITTYDWEIIDGNLTNKKDITQPVITLLGESTIIMTVNDTYVDAGATATDNIDRNLTQEIIKTSTVNTSKSGTYTITYIVYDNAGNKARVHRTVIVNEVSDTKPVIKLLGKSSINLTTGENYTDKGAIAHDQEDGDISTSIIINNPVNTSIPATYTITYNVIDSDNNKALEVSRIVTVTKAIDKEAPVVILNGQDNISIARNSTYIEQGATVTDNIDTDLEVTIEGSVDTTTLGTYNLTYSAVDSAGNQGTVSRVVNIIDTSKPIITLLGQSPIDIVLGEIYNDSGATAQDKEDGNITKDINTSNLVNTDKVGEYTITYNVSDSAGNKALEVSRIVNVTEAVIQPDYNVNIELSQTHFTPGETPVTITLNISELIGGTNTGDLELSLTNNEHFNLTLENNSDWELDNDQLDFYKLKYIKNNGKYTLKTVSTIILKGTFYLENGSRGSFPMTVNLRSGSGDTNNNNDYDSKQVTYDTQVQTITRQDPHTHSNCLGHIEKSGLDNNRNSLLDDEEITSSTPIYTEGTPLTREELVTMIANNDDVTGVNTCEITDMSSLFYQNENFNQDIREWNIGSVTDISYMFSFASNFNQDIGNWNVSNVSNMKGVFYKATSFNQDIGEWNVSKVTDMYYMFLYSPFNQDINQWDVSNVTNMEQMFHFSNFNSNISNWDVSNVTNIESIFANSPFNQDVSQWDVSNVTSMVGTFSNSPFNQDISQWNVSKVKDMYGMFINSPFNQDISQWDVSNVTNMDSMFQQAIKFNQDISQWDMSNVTNMRYMFNETSNFNQPINNWDVSNVTIILGMFKDATNFNQDISSWKITNVTNMESIFQSASKFNQDLEIWDVTNVTEMQNAFKNTPSLTKKPSWYTGER